MFDRENSNYRMSIIHCSLATIYKGTYLEHPYRIPHLLKRQFCCFYVTSIIFVYI